MKTNKLLPYLFIIIIAIGTLSISSNQSFPGLPCDYKNAANYWFFGDSVGLDFSNGTPELITGQSIKTYEASTSAVDADGNLLFYSNGEQVWNRNHELMPFFRNGQELGGHNSAAQIIALPQPGSDHLWYLLYSDGIEEINNLDTNLIMYYSIINLNLDNGMGDILQSDVILQNYSTEKVAATKHCNGKDWWIMTRKADSNSYNSWLLSETGLKFNISQSIGYKLNELGGIGSPMKFSHNGNHLAAAHHARIEVFNNATYDGVVEIFEFDKSTAILKNNIILKQNLRSTYGIEFSPDNTKLYTTETMIVDSIIQYDISIYNKDSILASKHFVGQGFTLLAGGMQLAPDGKIYIANLFNNYLDIIHNPNEKGAACNFEKLGLELGGRECGLSLPNFPSGFFEPNRLYLSGLDSVCLIEDTVVYRVNGACPGTYDWQVSGGRIVSDDQDSVLVAFDQTGIQEVIVTSTWDCGVRSDTMRVDVVDVVDCNECQINFDWTQKDTIGCEGDQLTLLFETNVDTVFLENNISGYKLMVDQQIDFDYLEADSCYRLLLMNNGQCDSVLSFCVNVMMPSEEKEFRYICWGDSTWFSDRWLDQPGNYTDTLINQEGCDSIVILELKVTDQLIIDELDVRPACSEQNNGQIKLLMTGGTAPYNFKWSHDSLLKSRIADTLVAGIYTVSVSDFDNCTIIREIEISQYEELDGYVEIEPVDCNYEWYWVRAKGIGGHPPYLSDWEDPFLWGNTNRLSDPGMYSVTIYDTNFCEKVVAFEILSRSMLLLDYELRAVDCGNGLSEIEIVPQGGEAPYQYAWSHDPTLSAPLAKDLQPGDYTIVVTDINGCTQMETITIETSFSIMADVRINKPPTCSSPFAIVAIEAQGGIPPYTYRTADQVETSGNLFTNVVDSIFTYEVIDQEGCIYASTVSIDFPSCFDLYAPNIFSPNADGHNDRFTLFGPAGTQILRLQIYSRWGELVYENQDFTVGTGGWDGTFRNELLDAGVFVWTAEVLFPDGEVIQTSGDVVLMR